MLSRMIVFAKTVAKNIESKIECKRIGLAVIGLEVPHAHIHLVPINSINDINFSASKLVISAEELQDTSNLISF